MTALELFAINLSQAPKSPVWGHLGDLMILFQSHISQLPKSYKGKKPDKQGRNSSGKLAGRQAQGWVSGTAVKLQDGRIGKSES